MTSADVLVCCLVLHAYVGVIDMTSDGVVFVLFFFATRFEKRGSSVLRWGVVKLIRFCWERLLSVSLDCCVVLNRDRLLSHSCSS